jgi:hypothetical protein
MVVFDVSNLQRMGKVYDLATKVKVVRDGDSSFEQNRGSHWTDWTHSGLGKYALESTDERESASEAEESERENGPTNDSIQSMSSKDVSNAPPRC